MDFDYLVEITQDLNRYKDESLFHRNKAEYLLDCAEICMNDNDTDGFYSLLDEADAVMELYQSYLDLCIETEEEIRAIELSMYDDVSEAILYDIY